MSEGSNGFGGLSGLFGTAVEEVPASQHREFFCCLTPERTTVGSESTCLTPVPKKSGRSAESLRTFEHRWLSYARDWIVTSA